MTFGGLIGTGIPPLSACAAGPAALMGIMGLALLAATVLVLVLARRGAGR
jgi:hypothetical protein